MNNNFVKQIDYITIYPNKKYSNYNNAFSVTLEMEICPDDKKTHFKIIDLDPPEPPKEMTKKEIEELFGYKLKLWSERSNGTNKD